MFSKNESKSSAVADEITAFLGKETSFEGKMTFQGVFRLDGKFQGEIFESGTLIVGETAIIKGKISVQSIVILGQIEGDVYATSRAEIHATGRLHGTLFTPVLTVNDGGVLDGQCKMEAPSSKKDEDEGRFFSQGTQGQSPA